QRRGAVWSTSPTAGCRWPPPVRWLPSPGHNRWKTSTRSPSGSPLSTSVEPTGGAVSPMCPSCRSNPDRWSAATAHRSAQRSAPNAAPMRRPASPGPPSNPPVAASAISAPTSNSSRHNSSSAEEASTVALPALVLVHGGVHAADCWDLLVAELGRQDPELRTLAVDLPGRGRTPGDLATATVDQWVHSVVGDIEAAGLGDIVIVGHSMAGVTVPGVVAELGARRVREMVLVSAFVPPQGQAIV